MTCQGNERCCRRTENAILIGGLVITAATLILGITFSRHLRALVTSGTPSGLVRVLSPAAEAAGANR